MQAKDLRQSKCYINVSHCYLEYVSNCTHSFVRLGNCKNESHNLCSQELTLGWGHVDVIKVYRQSIGKTEGREHLHMQIKSKDDI